MTEPNPASYNDALEKGIELAAATLRAWGRNRLSSNASRVLNAAADDLINHKQNITATHQLPSSIG